MIALQTESNITLIRMKLPQKPAPWIKQMQGFPKERVEHILMQINALAKLDRYLHWDELRHRPAPDGLSHEEWWLGIKLARMPKLRSIPLLDKKQHPFQFGIPDKILAQLHEIDRGLGFTLDTPDGVTAPGGRDQYIISSLIQESITSSQLEGAATTREAAKELLRTGRQPRDKSERMILNNYVTMKRIRTLRDQPLTPKLVLELHALVTADTLDRPDASGRFRLPHEDIRVEDQEGTIFHVPPDSIELPDRLAAMCDFANRKTPDFFVHPVVRAIILHFWLGYDHPFVDGNGRTARALFYWSMLHQGYQLFEFISISQILLRSRSHYARAFLHTETDDNDLTYFILHQIEVICEAVDALHAYVKHRTEELRSASQRLRGLGGLNHRQQALLAHSLREPNTRYLIEGHRRSHNVAFQTARDDLFGLAEKSLLVVQKEGRVNAFYAPADLGHKLEGLAVKKPDANPSADHQFPMD